jgi:hypothetical protein
VLETFDALIIIPSRQMLEHAIEAGTGGRYLRSTPEQ